MDLKKKLIKEKIHSVKTWLDKAESSYDDDSKAKGELNILMAKAEMQHLEEKNKPFVKGYTLLGLPFVFFAIVVICMTFWVKNTPSDITEQIAITPHEEQTNVYWSEEKTAKSLFEHDVQLKFTPLEEPNEVKTVTLPDAGKVEINKVTPAVSKTKKIMNASDVKKAVYEASKSLRGE